MTTQKEQPKKDMLRLLLGGVVILILALVIVIQNLSDRGMTLWQTKEDMQKAQKELIRNQKQLQVLLNDMERLNIARETFKDDPRRYWLVGRDGKVEGNVQKIVEKAASTSGLKLSSLSNLRSQKIGEYGVLYEMTTTAEAPMKPVTQFIETLKGMSPKFYWQSCSIRPKIPAGGDEVRFQGGLVFVSLVDDELIKILLE